MTAKRQEERWMTGAVLGDSRHTLGNSNGTAVPTLSAQVWEWAVTGTTGWPSTSQSRARGN